MCFSPLRRPVHSSSQRDVMWTIEVIPRVSIKADILPAGCRLWTLICTRAFALQMFLCEFGWKVVGQCPVS